MISMLVLAAMQVPSSVPVATRDDRTAFCWAALTNAAIRTAAQNHRISEALSGALDFINGKMRGRYADDEQLVAALRSGSEAFGRAADINEAALGCLRDYREEMSQFTALTVRSMR